jgi:hypothetical protein
MLSPTFMRAPRDDEVAAVVVVVLTKRHPDVSRLNFSHGAGEMAWVVEVAPRHCDSSGILDPAKVTTRQKI